MLNTHPILVSSVVDVLDHLLPGFGFERKPLGLYEATSDNVLEAGWTRDSMLPEYGGDSISVWSHAYVNVDVGGTYSRVEWRDAPLDPDEFGQVVIALVRRMDELLGRS